MIDSNAQFEHWPRFEEITEKYYRQRYYYGEAQENQVRIGRIVQWYRMSNYWTRTPIQPIVRFHLPDGAEGEPEYVKLGSTEHYWIADSVDDIREAWQEAKSTNRFPRWHGQGDEHPANPFYVDPAHFLLAYGELRNDELVFGRVVGWDPPAFADELPHPMVRLCRVDGTLEPEPLYVGSVHDPEHYWVGPSENEIRQRVADWRVVMAGLAEERTRERSSRPSRTMAEVLPVWEEVIEAAGRRIGQHVVALGRQATLTRVEHDTVVVTMPSEELSEQMMYHYFSFTLALEEVLGGRWELEVLLADGAS